MTHSRKQSFITQAFQFADALLVWVAFLIGAELRDVVRYLLDMGTDDEAMLVSMNWILYVCVPFIPLLLDRFGFYERMRQKTTRTSVAQLLRVLLVIILSIGVIAVFAKWLDARRLILSIGLIFVFVLLFCLLYTSPSPRDRTRSRMPSSA